MPRPRTSCGGTVIEIGWPTKCTDSATVPAGHTAVLLRPSGVDREPLRDGEHFIGPLGVVETYDLQAQEQSEDLDALSADGMMLEAHLDVLASNGLSIKLDASVRYHLNQVAFRDLRMRAGIPPRALARPR